MKAIGRLAGIACVVLLFVLLTSVSADESSPESTIIIGMSSYREQIYLRNIATRPTITAETMVDGVVRQHTLSVTTTGDAWLNLEWADNDPALFRLPYHEDVESESMWTERGDTWFEWVNPYTLTTEVPAQVEISSAFSITATLVNTTTISNGLYLTATLPTSFEPPGNAMVAVTGCASYYTAIVDHTITVTVYGMCPLDELSLVFSSSAEQIGDFQIRVCADEVVCEDLTIRVEYPPTAVSLTEFSVETTSVGWKLLALVIVLGSGISLLISISRSRLHSRRG